MAPADTGLDVPGLEATIVLTDNERPTARGDLTPRKLQSSLLPDEAERSDGSTKSKIILSPSLAVSLGDLPSHEISKQFDDAAHGLAVAKVPTPSSLQERESERGEPTASPSRAGEHFPSFERLVIFICVG